MKNNELDRLKKIAELVDAMTEGLDRDDSEDGVLAVGEVATDDGIFENGDDTNPFELSWKDPSDEPLVIDLRNRK